MDNEAKRHLLKFIEANSYEDMQSAIIRFLRARTDEFAKKEKDISQHFADEDFPEIREVGEMGLSVSNGSGNTSSSWAFIVVTLKITGELTERRSKKKQFDKGREILKRLSQGDIPNLIGGFFIFYDEQFHYRWSLIYQEPVGRKVKYSPYKRYTYYVSKSLTNKTFIQQLCDKTRFYTLENIKSAFSVEKVTKEFYNEIANWYFWAMDKIHFPDDYKYSDNSDKDKEIRNATNLIRLITRIIFIWFLKEKGLVPTELFAREKLKDIVKDFMEDKKSSNFYNAILQNLFFATLNQKMGERKFAEEEGYVTNKKEYGVKNLFRYADKFLISKDEVLKLFKDIPFLNGGLFDCLDKEDDTGRVIYIDGFSRNPKKVAIIPDFLFFQEQEESVNLSGYGLGENKSVRGLIEILNSYNFTIDENTIVDQEVALDPELLGKIFENLLASYNPETATTARKATGSFYTPREIVDYMVDESLKVYLSNQTAPVCPQSNQTAPVCPQNNQTVPVCPQSNQTVPVCPQNNQTAPVCPQSNQTVPVCPQSNQTVPVCPEEAFYSENKELHISYGKYGKLPHWKQGDVWYFVTFRLDDSLPAEKIQQLKREREEWLKAHGSNLDNLSKQEKKEYYRLFSERVDNWLDAGYGKCYLKQPEIARMVADALLFFNHKRYVLDDWVIMPNHVHVLVKPIGENKLSDILHSWKSYTAHQITKLVNRKESVWMHESYDHIVRNEGAFNAIRNYIRENPVKANIELPDWCCSWRGSLKSEDALTTSGKSRDALTTSGKSEDALTTSGKSGDALTTSGKSEDALATLVSYTDEVPDFSEEEKRRIISAIDNIKILDPACGSGAFLMGVLHKLVFILQKLDPENKYWKELQYQKVLEESQEVFKEEDRRKREELLKEINEAFDENINHPDYARKLYLIENCIYGVDIQPIAIQISKLRFFISLVLDQKVDRNKENFGIRALPNLETKFVAGDTLIGLQKPEELFYTEEIKNIEKEIKTLRHKYFQAKTRQEKLKYQKRDKELREELAKKLQYVGFPYESSERIAKFDLFDQNASTDWFDPEWMLGVRDGFDIVIGNPPYIQLQKNGGQLAKKYKPCNYEVFERTGDIYALFYERGIQLLKEGGILCLITSNKWMRAGYGEKLRLFFMKHNPIVLIDLGPGVFESATVDTNILLIQKLPNPDDVTKQLSHKSTKEKVLDGYQLQAVTLEKTNNEPVSISEQLNDRSVVLTRLSSGAWFIGGDAEQRLKEKIERIGKPLKDWDVKIYYGIKTGLNEAFIVTTEKRNEILANCKDEAERLRTEAIIKPILRGRDIKRYYYEWAGLWMICTFPPLKLNIDDYPSLKRYFLENFDIRRLEQSGKKYPELGVYARKKTGNKWFETQDQIAYYSEFEKEKVVWAETTQEVKICIVEKDIYLQKTCFMLSTEYPKYTTGLINSRIIDWFVRRHAHTLGNSGIYLSEAFMENLPLPLVSVDNELIVRQIESLVDKIIMGKRQNPQADTSQLEREVDRLVYQLYDLTPEEIKIIEQNMK